MDVHHPSVNVHAAGLGGKWGKNSYTEHRTNQKVLWSDTARKMRICFSGSSVVRIKSEIQHLTHPCVAITGVSPVILMFQLK